MKVFSELWVAFQIILVGVLFFGAIIGFVYLWLGYPRRPYVSRREARRFRDDD